MVNGSVAIFFKMFSASTGKKFSFKRTSLMALHAPPSGKSTTPNDAALLVSSLYPPANLDLKPLATKDDITVVVELSPNAKAPLKPEVET